MERHANSKLMGKKAKAGDADDVVKSEDADAQGSSVASETCKTEVEARPNVVSNKTKKRFRCDMCQGRFTRLYNLRLFALSLVAPNGCVFIICFLVFTEII